MNYYNSKTVLVTGGLGFLGSALVSAISSVQCHITLLVRHSSHVDIPEGTLADFTILRGDIETVEPWAEALEKVDVIFHFAGQTDARVADQSPLADFFAAVSPALHLLESCRRLNISPTILFAGTVTQVGMAKILPINENFNDRPLVVYEIHKLAIEKYSQFFFNTAKIPTLSLRLANVYGPGVRESSQDRGVLNLMIKKALAGETLTVFGTGKPIRDYIYIDDVVRAFLLAGSMGPNLAGNYYLVGSGKGTSISDVINLVADRTEIITGVRPPVEHVPSPDDLSPYSERDFVVDSTLFQQTTGWRPKIALSDGIDRSLEYFQMGENPSAEKDLAK